LRDKGEIKMGEVNGSTTGDASGFTIKREPVENLRPLRVVVVGAGFSGIVAAIRYASIARTFLSSWGY